MKKLIIASLLGAMSFTASAQWDGGLGYVHMSEEVLGQDMNLGAMVLNLRYDFTPEEKLHWIPGIRLGKGVKGDAFNVGYGEKVDIELERFMSIDFRLQNDFNENLYVYLAPSYANAKFTAEDGDYKESHSEWELGGGVGIGLKFNQKNSIEASYETFDGTDLFSLSWIGTF